MADNRYLLTRSACNAFQTQTEALEWVTDAIAELGPEHFAHSAQLAIHIADVYGIVAQGLGWYLKLTVTEDVLGKRVLVISCHPVEYPLKTQGGTIEP